MGYGEPQHGQGYICSPRNRAALKADKNLNQSRCVLMMFDVQFITAAGIIGVDIRVDLLLELLII